MGRAQEWPRDDDAMARIADDYRWPETVRPWVRSNFVATVDGRVQGEDGRSGTINTEADHLVFDCLRALCDVVVVGAGTARTEGYRAVELTDDQRRIRHAAGLTGLPTLVVVTGSLALPPDLVASAAAGPVVAITGSDHDARDDLGEVEVQTVTGSAGSQDRTEVDPAAILELCHGRGWSRVLLEGGPSLHHDFLSADLVDEICLSIAPTVRGGSGLGLVNGDELAPARDFGLAGVVLVDDTVMARWTRQDRDGTGS